MPKLWLPPSTSTFQRPLVETFSPVKILFPFSKTHAWSVPNRHWLSHFRFVESSALPQPPQCSSKSTTDSSPASWVPVKLVSTWAPVCFSSDPPSCQSTSQHPVSSSSELSAFSPHLRPLWSIESCWPPPWSSWLFAPSSPETWLQGLSISYDPVCAWLEPWRLWRNGHATGSESSSHRRRCTFWACVALCPWLLGMLATCSEPAPSWRPFFALSWRTNTHAYW